MAEYTTLCEDLTNCTNNHDCENCKRKDASICIDVLMHSAVDAIKALQAENERLRKKLDAAKKYIPQNCETCIFYKNYDCVAPDNEPCDFYARELWQWRGEES